MTGDAMGPTNRVPREGVLGVLRRCAVGAYISSENIYRMSTISEFRSASRIDAMAKPFSENAGGGVEPARSFRRIAPHSSRAEYS